jgi:translation initiation factor IF-3
MQPKIEIHDLEFKTKHIQDFLEQGSKVKVTIRFRGRELAHTELGRVVLDRILDMLEIPYAIDRKPMMEGRFMSMILSPSGKGSG